MPTIEEWDFSFSSHARCILHSHASTDTEVFDHDNVSQTFYNQTTQFDETCMKFSVFIGKWM